MARRVSVWAIAAIVLTILAVVGVILPGATTTATAQQAAPSTTALERFASSPNWRSGGPFGGGAQSLVLSPDFATDGRAFAGGWRLGQNGVTGGYGIVRTTDHGATWLPVFSGPPWSQLAVMDLAVSPAFGTDAIAFAATESGLLRTRNHGATWERLHGGLPEAGNDPAADNMARVYLSPDFVADGTLLALLADSGLFVSNDQGDTWRRVAVVGTQAVTFARAYATNGTIFAIVSGGDLVGLSLARSMDRGTTWQIVQPFAGVSAFDLLEAADAALLVAGDGGVSRLVPAGDGYTSEPVSPNVGGAVRRLAAAGDHFYAAAETGLFISLSAGRRWDRYSDTPAAPFQTVAACPQWGRCHAVLAGTAFGVLGALDDNLEPWRWLAGPTRVATASIAASPGFGTDQTLFAGTDQGLFRTTDGGWNWRLVTPGERPDHDSIFSQVRVSASYAADGRVWAVYEDRVSGRRGLYQSSDRGESWSAQFAPFGLNGRLALAVSPAYRTDRTLFVAQNDLLHKSTDGGATWQDYAVAPADLYFTLLRLEVSSAYAADRTLYASGYDGVRRSTDGGVTWHRLSALAPAYGLAISPAYATDRTVWHTFRAIEGAGDGSPDSAVRRSTDGGATWDWATAGLPGVYEPFPVSLAASPAYSTDHTLFTALSGPLLAGTEHKLYRSLTGGTTWQDLGPAPGNPNPTDLAITANTFGRLTAHLATEVGVWHYLPDCEDRIINGGFEMTAAWQIPNTAYSAAYSTSRTHSGQRALRAGIVADPDVYSYSSALQVVTIPANAENAHLNFWWYPISAEPPLVVAQSEPPLQVLQAVAKGVLPAEILAGDWQYALLLDDQGNILLNSPRLWTRSNAQSWQQMSLDLGAYRGRTLQIVFGVLNDGDGRRTAMYVDDVALTTCWPPVATPTPTPTHAHPPVLTQHVYVPLNLFPAPDSLTATPTATATLAATSTPTPSYTPTPTATADTDSDRNAYGDFYADTVTHADGDRNAYGDRYAYADTLTTTPTATTLTATAHADSDRYAYGDRDANTFTHADADADTYADAHGHGDCDADRDAVTDTYANCDLDEDPDGDIIAP